MNWQDEQKEEDIARDKAVPDGEDIRPGDAPWWERLVSSIRPTAGMEVDKKTGKPDETIGIQGGIKF